MGVGKGFWDQLRPLARKEDLSFLRGKRLAIDLSYWLVQQQTALKDQYVRKPHLRLTFYRVVKLMAKVGALPVFVVDGEPPSLKQGVRMKRFKRFADTSPYLLSEPPASQEGSNSRNGIFHENVEDCVLGHEPSSSSPKPLPVAHTANNSSSQASLRRPRSIVSVRIFFSSSKQEEIYPPLSEAFFMVIKARVQTLLELLGVPVLRATGEAESLCAALNREGLVDACVSPDSDAFVHGAKWVIKTLQLEQRNEGPEVELYGADDIEASMGLRREHLLALALLVGCDYSPEGVPGVGCTNARRLISCFAESEILDRLRAWGRGELPLKNEVDLGMDVGSGFETVEYASENLSKVTHCSKCGHPGNKREHANSGCQPCTSYSKELSIKADCKEKPKDFVCTCPFCLQKAQNKMRKKSKEWWAKMCHKMASTPGFPNEEIITLFLNSEIATAEDIKSYSSSIIWRAPTMEELEIFLQRHLYWDSFYVRQKVLPLLSLSYLKELAAMKEGASCTALEKFLEGAYAPQCIDRIKIEQGEPLYMLKWKSLKGIDGQQWLGLKLKSTSSKTNKTQRIGKTGENDMDGVEFPETDAEESEWCFTTVENMELIKAACPDLVDKFATEQEAKQAARSQAKKRKNVEDNEPAKRQSNITSFFKQKHIAHSTLKASSSCEKLSMEELSPHTPGRMATGPGYVDAESLIASLNLKSTSTIFSLVSSAPVPATPRRRISRKVARRLSLEERLS